MSAHGLSVSGSAILLSGSSITIQSGSIRTPLEFGVAGVTGSVFRNTQGNIIAVSGSAATNLTYDTSGNIITVINTVLGINYTGSVNYDSAGNITSTYWSN